MENKIDLEEGFEFKEISISLISKEGLVFGLNSMIPNDLSNTKIVPEDFYQIIEKLLGMGVLFIARNQNVELEKMEPNKIDKNKLN
jgi:hypothetical protein